MPTPKAFLMQEFDYVNRDNVAPLDGKINSSQVLDSVIFTGEYYSYSGLLEDTIITFKGKEVECIVEERIIELSGTLLINGKEIAISPSPYRFNHRVYYAKGIGWIWCLRHFPEHDWGFGKIPFMSYIGKVYDYHIE